MVFVAALAAAAALGVGWVLQQRTAAHAAVSELLSFRLLLHLMRRPAWWAGIAAMAAGQGLGAWALDLGSVGLVEPLLSANLLVAVVAAAVLTRRGPTRSEVTGALLLSAALAVFIGIGNPRPGRTLPGGLLPVVAAAGAVAVTVAVLVATARRRSLGVESVLLAGGAGVLYGLQDVCTRGALVDWSDHGLTALVVGPWAYLVVAAAVFGLLLSQSAFRAARLDTSLPPTAATEPVVAVALGTALLGDHLAVGPGPLLAESLCVLAMAAGAVLIARAPSLKLHLVPVGAAHRAADAPAADVADVADVSDAADGTTGRPRRR